MARNLRGFKNGGNSQPKFGSDSAGNSQPKSGSESADNLQQAGAFESAGELFNKYGGKSEAELMDELLRVTAQQKQAGAFDAEAMHRTAGNILPMLTPQQAEKLNAILSRLG